MEDHMDLYSIGEMVIDFLPGDTPDIYIRNPGGAPANVAVAVARSGLEAGFCGKLGNDDFGQFLLKTLRDNNVAVLCPTLCDTAVTTMAFVTLQSDGERSFTFARKPGADMFLEVSDVLESHLESTRIVHAGSCSLSKGSQVQATMHALRRGHELGKLVSFDMNYRSLLWDGDREACTKSVLEILPWVDCLKVSEEEIDMIGSEETIPELMKKMDLSVVVETLGSKGATCWLGSQKLFEGCPNVSRVDTTGAGDAFWGAFLSGLILNHVETTEQITPEMIRTCMRRGNVAGSLCVQKKGAIHSLPTRAEIDSAIFS
jgi:sugar/nucleoside kinase (ribokinase family)